MIEVPLWLILALAPVVSLGMAGLVMFVLLIVFEVHEPKPEREPYLPAMTVSGLPPFPCSS